VLPDSYDNTDYRQGGGFFTIFVKGMSESKYSMFYSDFEKFQELSAEV
jgi:hypothetical protein